MKNPCADLPTHQLCNLATEQPSMFRSLCAAAALLALAGCDNWMAKNFGGAVKIHLDPGLKVMMVTWKDDDIWVQTRPMDVGEKATTVTFKEWSKTGFLSGRVTVVEHNYGG